MDNIELNKELLEECLKENVNFDIIKELLNEGANPLGRIDDKYDDEFLFDELLCECQDEITPPLSTITKLFLYNGMDIEKANNIDNCDHLQCLEYVGNQEGIKTLELFLDNNLSSELIASVIDHIYTNDIWMIRSDLKDEGENHNIINESLKWECVMKILFLCLAYDYIFDNCENLRKIVDFDSNSYDRHKFKCYDNYYIKAENEMIKVYEKETKDNVWNIKL